MRISTIQVLILAALLLRGVVAQDLPLVHITEVVSDNRTGLRDADGYASDWIELFNASNEPVSLAGFQLCDDDDRPFTFPDVILPARKYLVVFASGKGRAVAGEALHTSFRLSRGGERVRLLAPDGAVVSELTYGRQQPDVSTGRRQEQVLDDLLPTMSLGQFLVPKEELPEGWRLPEFDAADWHAGMGGFGFDVLSPEMVVAAQVIDIGPFARGQGTTICYRFPFELPELLGVWQLALELRATGGFVVYLNGTEVARHRAKDTPKFDAVAVPLYEERDVLQARLFDLTEHRTVLRASGNVLAVHALLDHKNVTRHLLQPRLLRSQPGELHEWMAQFPSPTPGRANEGDSWLVPGQAKIEPAGGLFDAAIAVRVAGGGEGLTLRYTLDGSEPQWESAKCPPELSIDRSCELRVRTFFGEVGGRTTTAQFTKCEQAVRAFSSNLPLLVVTTASRDVPVKTFTRAHVHAVDVAANGRAGLADRPQLSCRGAIKLRGSSTLPLNKKGYGLEFRDRSGADRDRALLGMPAGADWVLHAPHHWDQAHIRNALCYEIARRIGLAAPRCRFVELFVCDDGAPLSRRHYQGLYLLVEHISGTTGGVTVDKLGPRDVAAPAITGGYVFKRDRLGPGEVGFDAGGEKLQYVDPRETKITDLQRTWLRGFLGRFGQGLIDKVFDDAERGYAAFLDVDCAIDFHLHQEFTNNPDAFSLSTFYYKPRGGKLRVGPVWDFDRAFRTNDARYWLGRAGDPYGWTHKRLFGWWGKLFEDPAFGRAYRARGRELLRTTWSVARMHDLIDQLVAKIAEAERRDQARWPVLQPGEWENEIVRLKDYVANRNRWMAAELLEAPVFEKVGEGLPFDLVLRHGNKKGVLYYTTNGADPVLRSLAVSPYARVYDQPLPISADARIMARVKVGGLWSRRSDYAQHGPLPKLSISEVMYNPPGGRDYEFIEIVNYGDSAIDLRGIRITGVVEFAFTMGSMHTLMPGARVVVVQDPPKFVTRYDTVGMPIAGAYYGNCDNTAGDIVLRGSVGQEIARAHYQGDWLRATDGKGFSLVAIGRGPSLLEAGDWQRSPDKFGSPGR